VAPRQSPLPDRCTASSRAPAILAAFYSEAAPAYKEMWAPELLRLSVGLLDELPLAGARRVLDSGTGVGSLLPKIAEKASSALVVGVDVSHGMLALGPRDFPLAAMDAARLGLSAEAFDVCILAFMIFHLTDPVAGLEETARVLAPGGTVGTITWGDDPSYPALDIWLEELEGHGAAPAGEIARHGFVNTPAKVEDLLTRTGYGAIRTWTGRYENRMTPEEFLAHRIGHGQSRRRFESLNEDLRSRCLERVRSRLQRLDTDDIVDCAEVIYAVATAP
jgi:SAM-dependent methyltransferase